MQQEGIRSNGGTHWNRNKSISEANLLAPEYNFKHPPVDPRRASVAEFGHHHDVVDHHR